MTPNVFKMFSGKSQRLNNSNMDCLLFEGLSASNTVRHEEKLHFSDLETTVLRRNSMQQTFQAASITNCVAVRINDF